MGASRSNPRSNETPLGGSGIEDARESIAQELEGVKLQADKAYALSLIAQAKEAQESGPTIFGEDVIVPGKEGDVVIDGEQRVKIASPAFRYGPNKTYHVRILDYDDDQKVLGVIEAQTLGRMLGFQPEPIQPRVEPTPPVSDNPPVWLGPGGATLPMTPEEIEGLPEPTESYIPPVVNPGPVEPDPAIGQPEVEAGIDFGSYFDEHYIVRQDDGSVVLRNIKEGYVKYGRTKKDTSWVRGTCLRDICSEKLKDESIVFYFSDGIKVGEVKWQSHVPSYRRNLGPDFIAVNDGNPMQDMVSNGTRIYISKEAFERAKDQPTAPTSRPSERASSPEARKKAYPKTFHFTANDLDRRNLSGRFELVGANEDNPHDIDAIARAIETKGIKGHVYMMGPGMWEWPGEIEMMYQRAKEMGIIEGGLPQSLLTKIKRLNRMKGSRWEQERRRIAPEVKKLDWYNKWMGGVWIDYTIEKAQFYADKKNFYSFEIDNVDSTLTPDQLVSLYQRIEREGNGLKIMPKNITIAQAEAVTAAIKAGVLNIDTLAPYAIYEESCQKGKYASKHIMEALGIMPVNTTNTYAYESPQRGYRYQL